MTGSNGRTDVESSKELYIPWAIMRHIGIAEKVQEISSDIYLYT